MHFVVNRDFLVGALRTLQAVVQTKLTMPVLGGVLITSNEEALELCCTDLDHVMKVRIKAKVSRQGKCLLPVRRLASIVNELGGTEVTVKCDNQTHAALTCAQSSYKIMALPPEDFPTQPDLPTDHKMVIAEDKFSHALKRVSYAQSVDESRYALAGVYFKTNDDSLCLVATDGRRLAKSDAPMENAPSAPTDFILPSKGVATIEKLLGDKSGTVVTISSDKKKVTFAVPPGASHPFAEGDVIYTSRLVEGVYPNYSQVIPKNNDASFQVEREALAQAIHRAELVTSDKSHSVKFALTKNELTITAESSDFGSAIEKVDAEYGGIDVKVAFNPKFLLDPLRAYTLDKISVDLRDEISPCVIRSDLDSLCVVMPVRL